MTRCQSKARLSGLDGQSRAAVHHALQSGTIAVMGGVYGGPTDGDK
jgi:hypothetical protein